MKEVNLKDITIIPILKTLKRVEMSDDRASTSSSDTLINS